MKSRIPFPQRSTSGSALLFLVSILAGLPAQEVPAGGAGAVEAKRSPAPDPASLLPERTLAHVTLATLPFEMHGEGLALVRILREPAVQAFLRPFEALARTHLTKQAGELRQETGLDLQLLVRLVERGLAFSFLGMPAPAPDGPAIPDLVLSFPSDGREDDVRRLVEGFEAFATGMLGGTKEDVALGGVGFHRLAFPDFEIFLGDHAGRFYAATSGPTMEEIVRRSAAPGEPGSLAALPLFRKVRGQVERENSVLSAYVDVKRLVGLMMKEIPTVPEESRDVMALSGLDAIEAAGYGVDLDGAGFRDRLYIHAPGGKGFFAAATAGIELASPAFVPAETALFQASCADLPVAFDALMEMLRQGYPRLAESWRQWIARFEGRLGAAFREDVLGILGPEYGFYAAWSGRALIPDVAVFLRIRDAARAAALMPQVFAAAADRGRIRELRHGSTVIHVLEMESLALPDSRGPLRNLKPAAAIVGEWLVVAPWPQVVKNLVHGLESGTARLAGRPDFRDALAHVRATTNPGAPTSLTYFDGARLAGFVLDNAVPLLQSLLPAEAAMAVDVAAFPPTPAVTRHLFATVGLSTATGEGTLMDLWSPTGVLPVYGAALAAMGASFVAVRAMPGIVVSGPGADAGKPPVAAAGPGDPADRVRSQAAALRTAVRVHAVVEGRLPSEAEWPAFLFSGTVAHPEPYLDTALFPDSKVEDPWSRPFLYRLLDGKGFEISSLGADGLPGGEGDAADLVLRSE